MSNVRGRRKYLESTKRGESTASIPSDRLQEVIDLVTRVESTQKAFQIEKEIYRKRSAAKERER